jgi:AraC-like DNA-binding protein
MDAFCAHLTTYQSRVAAGREVFSQAAGWLFTRVCAGNGYLITENGVKELDAGDVVMAPPGGSATLRASQLGDLVLCHFGVRAEQLSGVLTAGELCAVNAAGAGICMTCLIKRPTALAVRYAELCDLRRHQPAIVVRTAMLALAVQTFQQLVGDAVGEPVAAAGSEQKFAELTARLPESELLTRSAGELARQCGCTDRHFRRLFAGRFGASLKKRQIEWRVEQAKKLLLDSDAKVIDVAAQCGFRSLGQFNLTFKRMTRMTPSTWRKTFATAETKFKRQHPSLCTAKNYRGSVLFIWVHSC